MQAFHQYWWNYRFTQTKKPPSLVVEAGITLDKDQLKIIDFIEHVGRITTKDVINILNCPQRTAQLYLKRLKEMDIIVPVGKGPATHYTLK